MWYFPTNGEWCVCLVFPNIWRVLGAGGYTQTGDITSSILCSCSVETLFVNGLADDCSRLLLASRLGLLLLHADIIVVCGVGCSVSL